MLIYFHIAIIYLCKLHGKVEWNGKGQAKRTFALPLPKKWQNKRGIKNMKFKLKDPGMKATEWIILAITLILGVILVPIVVDQVQTANTTGWTFTGYSGAKTLFLLLPFIFIVGIVLYFILALLGKV
jgi:hypothetical protein